MMNAQLTQLRTLVIKELDPEYFNLDECQINYWIEEIPQLRERIFKEMQNEMLGDTENSLVERHLKQVQYDCLYLASALCKYAQNNCSPAALYQAAGDCIDQILTHIDNRYAGFFNLQKFVSAKQIQLTEHPRIKVSFSVDTLAYFFKLLNKAGGLDIGTFTQLMMAVSKNFITPGIGDGYISTNSLTVKYKQVVQTTAQSVRALLVKMLKLLDQEFG
jgi:hypothetical protein